MSVGTAIALVGTVMSAKTAIEGLKEGNLLKAVAGGVGAYFGASSLAGGAASGASDAATLSGTSEGAVSQTIAETSGANLGDQFVATQGMTGGAGQAITNGAGMNALDAGLEKAVSSMGADIGTTAAMPELSNFAAQEGLLEASTAIPSASSWTQPLTNGANTAMSSYQVAADPSILEQIKTFGGDVQAWAKENPFLASSTMQMGGGLLQGMGAQGRFDEEMAALEASRKRRQTTGNANFLRTTQYNPSTGRFEQVA